MGKRKRERRERERGVCVCGMLAQGGVASCAETVRRKNGFFILSLCVFVTMENTGKLPRVTLQRKRTPRQCRTIKIS
jgi:hypothetical protein